MVSWYWNAPHRTHPVYQKTHSWTHTASELLNKRNEKRQCKAQDEHNISSRVKLLIFDIFLDVSLYKRIPGLFSNDNPNWVHMCVFFTLIPGNLLSTGFMDGIWCKKIICLLVLITRHAVYIPMLLLLLQVYNKALTPFKRFLQKFLSIANFVEEITNFIYDILKIVFAVCLNFSNNDVCFIPWQYNGDIKRRRWF